MGHVGVVNTDCTTALDKIKHQTGMSFHTYVAFSCYLCEGDERVTDFPLCG